jgi:hypothetical protein
VDFDWLRRGFAAQEHADGVVGSRVGKQLREITLDLVLEHIDRPHIAND